MRHPRTTFIFISSCFHGNLIIERDIVVIHVTGEINGVVPECAIIPVYTIVEKIHIGVHVRACLRGIWSALMGLNEKHPQRVKCHFYHSPRRVFFASLGALVGKF